MGPFDFEKKKTGNVNLGKKSGSLRVTRPGQSEDEPNVLEAKGLSQAEIEVGEDTEVFRKKELTRLAELLDSTEMFDKKGWRAEDVLQNKKLKDELAKKLPPWFRYGKLEEHLKTLAKKK